VGTSLQPWVGPAFAFDPSGVGDDSFEPIVIQISFSGVLVIGLP